MAINSNEEKHENQPIGYKVYSDLSHKTLLQSDTLYKVYIHNYLFNLINLVHTSKISYLFPTHFLCKILLKIFITISFRKKLHSLELWLSHLSTLRVDFLATK
jgi:hypothetical protein